MPPPGPAERFAAGLPREEAARRLEEYGSDVVARERRTPVWRRVLQQLRDR
ncbi:cation-transporting P-type ATPase [Streptomyces antimycoticus]|uniref:Cation-transporting P-type ATPase N-terminal domain-containing protein n=1 Tax=Streptomyces mordarskii TaxID=1226758 RepID=A0ABP3NTJ1_9ACTN|nr:MULTISPECIES: cation-transporting P-type ATPase [unclassified Streptomyces]RSS35243.1 hypothetical protein EF902_38415 [Streptomyces sp. WAC05858]WTA80111.1 cation-transporting P-type ATPase [Streptomyces antimycoticus]